MRIAPAIIRGLLATAGCTPRASKQPSVWTYGHAWLGRVPAVDLVADVEHVPIIYREMANRADNALA